MGYLRKHRMESWLHKYKTSWTDNLLEAHYFKLSKSIYFVDWHKILRPIFQSNTSSSNLFIHYIDVIMTTMVSQIISLTVVYSTVYSNANQRKHQSSASLAFVWGIHRDRWIPRTKGQLRGKCFQLMTSSCVTVYDIMKVILYGLHAGKRTWKMVSLQTFRDWSIGMINTFSNIRHVSEYILTYWADISCDSIFLYNSALIMAVGNRVSISLL